MESNCVVGPSRAGPFNQRRSPSVANAALYPVMMWNGRFSSSSGDAFDNRAGFLFPAPEANTKFAPHDSVTKLLLAAQGHMPSTELPEMAGFRDTNGLLLVMSRFGGEFAEVRDNSLVRAEGTTRLKAQSNNLEVLSRNKLLSESEPALPTCSGVAAEAVPAPEYPIEAPNEPIRRRIVQRLQENDAYRMAFADAFPSVKAGGHINFAMVGEALAEFQLQLIFADAPIDRYMRGDRSALTRQEKEGALLFFGKANCASCHATKGKGQQLFSDFEMHNIGVPPLYPQWKPDRLGEGNVQFKGPNFDLDLGLAEFTNIDDRNDWYRFRTSPLRNVGLQPTFMHNGAFTTLEAAVEHHLDPKASLYSYDPAKANVIRLRHVGNRSAIAASISPLLKPVFLTATEKAALVAFLRNGLTDDRAKPKNACKIIPTSLPSGNALLRFEGC